MYIQSLPYSFSHPVSSPHWRTRDRDLVHHGSVKQFQFRPSTQSIFFVREEARCHSLQFVRFTTILGDLDFKCQMLISIVQCMLLSWCCSGTLAVPYLTYKFAWLNIHPFARHKTLSLDPSENKCTHGCSRLRETPMLGAWLSRRLEYVWETIEAHAEDHVGSLDNSLDLPNRLWGRATELTTKSVYELAATGPHRYFTV